MILQAFQLLQLGVLVVVALVGHRVASRARAQALSTDHGRGAALAPYVRFADAICGLLQAALVTALVSGEVVPLFGPYPIDLLMNSVAALTLVGAFVELGAFVILHGIGDRLETWSSAGRKA